jgi:hypothetical protein
MGIVYRIDKEKGCTVVRWDGVVAADAFLAHVKHLSSDPDWPPPRRLHLTDLHTTSLDVSMDEAIIEKAAEIYGEHRDQIAGMKVAIVAGKSFNKAVLFERAIARYGATAIVFNFLDSACRWLGIDFKEVRQTLRQLGDKAVAKRIHPKRG